MTEDEVKRRELVLAYKRTFATEDGQLVLADLAGNTLDRPALHYAVAAPISHDWLVWNEAQRSLVLCILGRVEAKLDAVQKTTVVSEPPKGGSRCPFNP